MKPAFPLEHGNLLAKGEDFEGGVAAAAQEDAECGENREGELKRDPTLITCRKVTTSGDLWCACKSSISRNDMVVSTDR
jgi:hypothetical protein